MPGCDPNDFQCDFDIAGDFSVEQNIADLSILIRDANLTLLGNEGAIRDLIARRGGTYLLTAESLAEFLESDVLMLVSADDSSIVYSDGEPFPEFVLTATLTGDEIRVNGGFDARAGDGIAIEFDLSVIPVPEPSSVALILLSCWSCGLRDRRHR